MEIAIISGKGGTGKSSISAALATVEPNVLIADCDVDAANLYLLFNPTIEKEEPFIGSEKAEIIQHKCTKCGICIDYCEFEAIKFENGNVIISEVLCDGCHLCKRICPTNAIIMLQNNKSKMIAGSFRNGKMVYGRLAPGEENSGKLVNYVRDNAKAIAKKENIQNIILDGPPGIGCPVISTITGVNQVVIVTEPTLSALSDLTRATEITQIQQLKTSVVINKFDLNPEISHQIEAYCKKINVPIYAKIPYDPDMVNAMVSCKSIIEYKPKSETSDIIRKLWHTLTH